MKARDYLDDDKYLAECLEILERKYKAGNNSAILLALHQCFIMGKAAPEWLRRAFIDAYEEVAAFGARSWDELFGLPVPKGAHLDARAAYAKLRYPVALRVALRDGPIEPDLFDHIGAELGIARTTASDVYYKHGGEELAEAIEPLVPFLRRRVASAKT
jgi:hypothetical protein